MRHAPRQPSRMIVRLTLLIGGVALLIGCETLERTIKDNPRTAAGAGVGGGSGALIGGLASGGTGAVVGALAGVLTGGVIGHVLDRQERGRAATAETLAYSEDKGNIVRIEAVSLNPQAIRPGETVNVNVQYAIITRDGTAPVRIREIRHIYHQGELVGNPVVAVERTDGTYWSTLPITLPASATPGRYEVVVGVEMNSALERWESGFTVLQQ
jgi:hypothetical protein